MSCQSPNSYQTRVARVDCIPGGTPLSIERTIVNAAGAPIDLITAAVEWWINDAQDTTAHGPVPTTGTAEGVVTVEVPGAVTAALAPDQSHAWFTLHIRVTVGTETYSAEGCCGRIWLCLCAADAPNPPD